MKPAAWCWLAARDVLSQKGRLAILAACITLSGTLFGLTLSAVVYLRSEVRPQLAEMFPERRVIVRPHVSELFLLRMEGPMITADAVAQFAAMPEVERVFPQLAARFPVSASFEMETFDVGFESDIILWGVDRELVENELELDDPFPPPAGSDTKLPVLISEFFLDAYNLGLAESAGMPRISRMALLGVEFEILPGESTIGLAYSDVLGKPIPSRIAGLTKNPNLFGVTIPRETLEELNRVHAPNAKSGYTALHLDLKSPEGVEAVGQTAREMGYNFEAQRETLGRYLRIVGTVELLLAGGFAMVAALAAVGLFTTMAAAIRERRPAWGLYRATGMKRRGLLLMAGAHALAAGVPSGLMAIVLCFGVGNVVDRGLGQYIGALSFLTQNPLAPGPLTVLGVMLFATGFALIPAIVFALPICAARPLRLLSERSL